MSEDRRPETPDRWAPLSGGDATAVRGKALRLERLEVERLLVFKSERENWKGRCFSVGELMGEPERSESQESRGFSL